MLCKGRPPHHAGGFGGAPGSRLAGAGVAGRGSSAVPGSFVWLTQQRASASHESGLAATFCQALLCFFTWLHLAGGSHLQVRLVCCDLCNLTSHTWGSLMRSLEQVGWLGHPVTAALSPGHLWSSVKLIPVSPGVVVSAFEDGKGANERFLSPCSGTHTPLSSHCVSPSLS